MISAICCQCVILLWLFTQVQHLRANFRQMINQVDLGMVIPSYIKFISSVVSYFFFFIILGLLFSDRKKLEQRDPMISNKKGHLLLPDYFFL